MPKKDPYACKFSTCTTAASFGYIGGKREFCSRHKKSGMINVVHPRPRGYRKTRQCRDIPKETSAQPSGLCLIPNSRKVNTPHTKLQTPILRIGIMTKQQCKTIIAILRKWKNAA
ncbi:MAG: hypothetical protein M0R33_14005 [Methylomonas sp.]|uniref:hypothetical protein n=1 Tax=Methylomonas sp. TaxID=418 RepID=UPI0025F0F851|nr:hypothetical protein [Methylomonas sp.]MCK9607550.1 hypothetical protein [Methylomonas sp.]